MKNKSRVAIINGGFGNISSIENSLSYLNVNNTILSLPINLKKFSHFILPGVGSFKKASKKLEKTGWFDALKNISKDRPILGICLGMQLMFKESSEEGKSKGLSFFDGKCEKFKLQNLPVPHIGFNNVTKNKSKIWKNIPENSPFYFVHSYRVSKENKKYNLSHTKYGEKFISLIEKDNLIGTQFHPEKSHSSGLILIKNFLNNF